MQQKYADHRLLATWAAVSLLVVVCAAVAGLWRQCSASPAGRPQLTTHPLDIVRDDWGQVQLMADWPSGGEPRLADSLRAWIVMRLTDGACSLTDSLTASQQINAAADSLLRFMQEMGVGDCVARYRHRLSLTCQTDYVVNYTDSMSVDLCGAHGLENNFCVSFDRLTGQPLRLSLIFTPSDTLESRLLTLIGRHIRPEHVRPTVMPIHEPSLQADGVLFAYERYETAPYADGQPEALIPYAELAELLTDELRSRIVATQKN